MARGCGLSHSIQLKVSQKSSRGERAAGVFSWHHRVHRQNEAWNYLRKRATFAGSTCLPGKLSSNVTLAGGCEGQAALSYARLSPAHGASSLARFQARVRE